MQLSTKFFDPRHILMILDIFLRPSTFYPRPLVKLNNLPQDSSDACIENIDNLCLSVQNIFTNAKIGVSGIIVRDDISVKDKIEEVKEGTKELCSKHKFIFIDNSNIQLNALNGSKLHLNARGSALLA